MNDHLAEAQRLAILAQEYNTTLEPNHNLAISCLINAVFELINHVGQRQIHPYYQDPYSPYYRDE